MLMSVVNLPTPIWYNFNFLFILLKRIHFIIYRLSGLLLRHLMTKKFLTCLFVGEVL